MSPSLLETIRAIVRDELRSLRTVELAVVQDQHPHAAGSDMDNYACTVVLRDSGIVLKRVPVATSRIGRVEIPSVGELVLVQFIGGSINNPVITARMYSDQQRPPPNDDGRLVVHLPLDANDSDAVHLEITSGDKREIVVRLGDALALTLKDDDPVVSLDVNQGKATVKIDRDGAVTLESQGKVGIKGNDVKVEGASVSVEAQGELKLKGSVVNIN